MKRGQRVAVVVVLLLATACSSGSPAPDSNGDVHTPDPPPFVDVASALVYFAGFESGAEVPALPEGAMANRLVGGCLEHFGISVTYAGAGGVLRSPDPGQVARARTLTELCLDAMAFHGLVDLSDDDPDVLRRRYVAYLASYRCLKSIGMEPDNPPPPLEDFINGQPWSPFDGIATLVNTEEGTLEGPAVECSIP